MKTTIVHDLFGRLIEIPENLWHHVCQQHPELINYLIEIKETTVCDCIINSFQVY